MGESCLSMTLILSYYRLKNLGILQQKIPALLTIMRRREQATPPLSLPLLLVVYITSFVRHHGNILPRLFLSP